MKKLFQLIIQIEMLRGYGLSIIFYHTHDGSNMQENDNFFTNDKSKCPDVVRFVEKEKLLPTIMLG